MSVLILSERDVERLLPMGECIAAMEDALSSLARDELHNPLRTVVRPPGSATLMGLMPGHRSSPEPRYSLKTICIAPGNPTLGLDSHQGFVALFDGVTGVLQALVNASAITAIRTAAVSAVATRALARAGSSELAILGAGVQARSHLSAMREVLQLERIRGWSRTPGRITELGGVEESASAEEAVRGADVVVTATTSPEPVLRLSWLKEGAHVNAVGASVPSSRELDSETMAAAVLFADRRESLENESGEFLVALREGAITPDHLRGELGEVLVGAVDGRRDDTELTVFKSLGLAVEDLAAAEHVVRRARAEGAGVEVDL